MGDYRIYDLRNDGQIKPPVRRGFASDAEAIAAALQVLNFSPGVEVWHRDRLVVRLRGPSWAPQAA